MLETRSKRTPSSSCLLLSRYFCNFFSIQFMDISFFLLLLRNFSSSLNWKTYLFFSLNVLLNERKITGNALKEKKSSIVNVEKWAYFTYLIWKYFGYICRNPLRVHRNGIDYHSLDPRQNNLQNEREKCHYNKWTSSIAMKTNNNWNKFMPFYWCYPLQDSIADFILTLSLSSTISSFTRNKWMRKAQTRKQTLSEGDTKQIIIACLFGTEI